MSKLRIEFQKGSYYHITNRTASGLILFNDEHDYLAFSTRLDRYAEECNIEIIVKSLMPTHYHLVIRQDGDITASKFLQKLSISYVRFFAKRYNHHGAVFGQRFSATEIVDIYQMRNTGCYVLANAYKAELVDNPLDWQYDDLALFYSKEFWESQIDDYLLESFGSLEGFKERFEVYIDRIKLFRSPVIHREPRYDVESQNINVKKKQVKKSVKQSRQSKAEVLSLEVSERYFKRNEKEYMCE